MFYDTQHPYKSNQVIEQIETYFRAFFAVTVLTVVSDVKDFIFIVVLVTIFNWLAGYLADKARGNPYQHKKTMQAVKELFLTNATLFFVALTCNMLEPGIDYKLIIKALTGIFLVIYARNITKNLRIVQPSNEFIRALDTIANNKYFQMKKKIKEGEFELPNERKDNGGCE